MNLTDCRGILCCLLLCRIFLCSQAHFLSIPRAAGSFSKNRVAFRHGFLCMDLNCGNEKNRETEPMQCPVKRGDHSMVDRRETFVIASKGAPLMASAALFGSTPRPCWGLSPEQASKAYDGYSKTYDSLDGGKASTILGIDVAREAVISKARGKVLEIGVGTGLNIPYYDGSAIESLTLVDISDGMLQEAKPKVESSQNLASIATSFVNLDATAQLVDKFGKESFDTVIDTFSLCVMGNQGASSCLEQISQVVKKAEAGGRVLLLENSRSSNPLLGLYQDATADAAAALGGRGCLYNQDVRTLIRSTNGMVIKKETEYAAGLFRFFDCLVA